MKKIVSLLLGVLLLAGNVACEKSDVQTEIFEQNTSGIEMPDIKIMPDSPVGEVELPSYEVEALIEVAKAYLARMNANQYEDPEMTESGEYWFIENATSAGDMSKYSPEVATSQNTYYSSCSPFVKDVFWQAWGENLTDKSWTAAQIAKDKQFSFWSYVPTKRETTAEKNKIKSEFLSTLIPGDVIALCHNGPAGHILIYMGNGWAIHCTGGSYNQKGNYPKTETNGSVQYRDINTFFDEGNYYYFWEKEIWSILRPTEYIKNIKLTEQTKMRMENLRDIYVEKISSHPAGKTAQPGDEITYGFYLRNYRNEDATVKVKDVIPENTTYISGGEKRYGKELSWSIRLESGEEKLVCYTVKIDNNEKLYDNGVIVSDKATAGGVILPCSDIYIMKALDDESMKKIGEVFKDLEDSEARGFELANEIYRAAGIKAILPEEDALIDSLFMRNDKGLTINPKSEYYPITVPTLYGGYKSFGDDAEKGDRNKFIDYTLFAGDVIICCEGSDTRTFMCIGDGKMLDLSVGASEVYEGNRYTSILRSVFGNDFYTVLRPAMAQ